MPTKDMYKIEIVKTEKGYWQVREYVNFEGEWQLVVCKYNFSSRKDALKFCEKEA